MSAQESIVKIPLWSWLQMVEVSIAKPNIRGHKNGVTPNTDLQYKLQKLKSRPVDILTHSLAHSGVTTSKKEMLAHLTSKLVFVNLRKFGSQKPQLGLYWYARSNSLQSGIHMLIFVAV